MDKKEKLSLFALLCLTVASTVGWAYHAHALDALWAAATFFGAIVAAEWLTVRFVFPRLHHG